MYAYLSLDRFDLILKTGDHAVQLSDLRFCLPQVIAILSSCCLNLLNLAWQKDK